jgi:two-component system, cell cycle response regulator DivK
VIVTRSSPATARAGARPVVLLVDRHRDTRDMYAHVLSHEGFDVDIADDSVEGASRLAHRLPELIVVEPSPRSDAAGYDWCRRVRQHADTCATPLVAVTAAAFPSDKERAFAAGCDVVLAKPCLPETLVSEVQRLLRRAPLTRTVGSGGRVPRADSDG